MKSEYVYEMLQNMKKVSSDRAENPGNKPRYLCRVCGGAFHAEPLLFFANMPKAAQFMPGQEELATERGADLEACQCAACGLVQLSNAPVPYYREVVRAAAFSAEMKTFRERQFADFVARYGLAGRKVFEIGAGRGEYLELMQAAGAEAGGIEYGEEAAAHCAGQGFRVVRGFIEHADVALPDAPYDAFFILNFLEHMPDPNVLLRGMGRNLADGAVGLVEVPNFDMIVKKQMFSEFIGDHLLYFTVDTLAATLAMNGFEVLECRPVWYDYILSCEVRKRSRLDLTGFTAFRERLHREVHAYIDRFEAGKIAVWGAGHQALAVLALLGLEEKIRYVVDSAPFKQGKYTPASHIPIVSPDRLTADPVSAMIVMAASYSDEVAGIVRARYDRDLHVAILRDHGLEEV